MSLMNGNTREPRDATAHLQCMACTRESWAMGIPTNAYARVEVLVTSDLRHVQLWCVRHQFSIVILELAGQLPPPPPMAAVVLRSLNGPTTSGN